MQFAWKITWVAESLIEQMDAAIAELSRAEGISYHRVTHLFGRMRVATIGDVVVFTAGTRARNATPTALAITQQVPHRTFFLGRPTDVRACCDYLDINNPVDRLAFEQFVTPRSKRSS